MIFGMVTVIRSLEKRYFDDFSTIFRTYESQEMYEVLMNLHNDPKYYVGKKQLFPILKSWLKIHRKASKDYATNHTRQLIQYPDIDGFVY